MSPPYPLWLRQTNQAKYFPSLTGMNVNIRGWIGTHITIYILEIKIGNYERIRFETHSLRSNESNKNNYHLPFQKQNALSHEFSVKYTEKSPFGDALLQQPLLETS